MGLSKRHLCSFKEVSRSFVSRKQDHPILSAIFPVLLSKPRCRCGRNMEEMILVLQKKCVECDRFTAEKDDHYLHCNSCGNLERGSQLADYYYA